MEDNEQVIVDSKIYTFRNPYKAALEISTKIFSELDNYSDTIK